MYEGGRCIPDPDRQSDDRREQHRDAEPIDTAAARNPDRGRRKADPA
jgi:hypothetical protein